MWTRKRAICFAKMYDKAGGTVLCEGLTQLLDWRLRKIAFFDDKLEDGTAVSAEIFRQSRASCRGRR